MAALTAEIDQEVSSGDFRAAMRRLAGGVSVITAGRGEDITGMTVTSVASLSADPPSLIVSINRSASSWPLVKRHLFFGVNILRADQLDVAERFSGKDGLKGADRFAGAEWRRGASGVPLLVGALAAIECAVEDIIERHSHAILIGRVLDTEMSVHNSALAYWQGDYLAIDRDEDLVRLAEVSLPAGRALRKPWRKTWPKTWPKT
jgi:flavin reductase (DIM6/NTAB) family NADH-FMN oxidoreductase RutF